jgi:PhnB protein
MLRMIQTAGLSACFALAAAACGGAERPAEPTTPEPIAEPTAESAERSPIPEHFARGPVPHLMVAGASEAIAAYVELFGAEEIYRAPGPDGIVLHAMLRIGDSTLTISDEQPAARSFAPGKFGGSPVSLHVYVDDAAEAHARALAAGATELAPVRYQFWGDRHGSFTGPFGHSWSVATRVAEIPGDEIARLAARALAGEAIEEPEAAEPLPMPEGWSTVTPSLVVPDVGAATRFYAEAFDATTRSQTPGPDGEPFHAEIQIRDQIIMLSRAMPGGEGMPALHAPGELGGTPVQLTYYVEDTDAAVARALEAGAEPRIEPQDMFWGDRWAEIEDPFGHLWSLATHIEEVSADEIEERMRALGD